MNKRRGPKGTGSIRQRGERCEATYSFVDAMGRRRRRSATFDTKTAARNWLTNRIAEGPTGSSTVSEEATVGEYLTTWMEGLSAQVSEKTVAWYRWATTNHLIPTLGHVRLDRITALHVDELLATKISGGTGRETVRAIRVTLGKAMGDAERKGLIAKNPVPLADKPRLPRHDATLNVWKPNDIALFLTETQADRFAALWRTAAMTGLRRSEVCGLQWSDIDLDTGILAVRRAVVMVRGRPHVKEPKTARSRRSVDLDDGTTAVLREWRSHQLEERLRAGEAWNQQDWVWSDQLGRRVNPEWVGKRFRKLIAGAELPTITMRQLRHSHATALLRAGIHPKIVQERLGHANIGITLDIYSSVLPTMQRDAAVRLANLIEGSGPDSTGKEMSG